MITEYFCNVISKTVFAPLIKHARQITSRVFLPRAISAISYLSGLCGSIITDKHAALN